MNTPGEVVEKVEHQIESAVKKVDDMASDALKDAVKRVPELANVVEVADEALAGSACSCGLFGWNLSVSKLHCSPAKPAVLSTEPPGK
uniref:Uncharacterized protein n=1 Tax=viral metagenome TaxID=1070528 RepID=A0A6C0JLM7_9ZZZZ